MRSESQEGNPGANEWSEQHAPEEEQLGARMTMTYQHRSIEGYAVSDGDIGEIYHASRLVDFGLAVASAFGGFALGLEQDLLFAPDLSPSARDHGNLVAMVCAVVALLAGALAFSQIARRRARVLAIKRRRGIFSRLRIVCWCRRYLLED